MNYLCFLPSCQRNAANTALKDSATDGLIACFIGSEAGIFGFVLEGNWWVFMGDTDLFGLNFPTFLSFLAILGDSLSSIPVDPIEKLLLTCVVTFSGEVCVPVCITFFLLTS